MSTRTRHAALVAAALALVPAMVSAGAEAPAKRRQSTRVIARVSPPGGPEDTAGVMAISQALGRTLSKYEKSRVDVIEGTPLVVIDAPREGIAELGRTAGVAEVVPDYIDEPYLLESVGVIGAPAAWQRGFNGNAETVVVLDTGIDRDHPFFAGRIVHEACFSSTVASDGSKSLCPNGTDQQAGPGSAESCSASVRGCGHGTHVAGIAAGAAGDIGGRRIDGVAPGAKIVAIQVFSRFDDAGICQGAPPCALTYTSDQIAALQHVRNIVLPQHPVAAINMSLGGGHFPTACDDDLRKLSIDALRSLGVATVIASGNDSFSGGIGAPACISSAISVGSTTKSDGISSFSNSATTLSLLAPGSDILSSVDGGGYGRKSGTSMATPHVTGAWAVLRSQRPNASVDEILTALETGGKPVTDSRNGLTHPRIDIAGSLQGDQLAGGPPNDPEPEGCWWSGIWPW